MVLVLYYLMARSRSKNTETNAQIKSVVAMHKGTNTDGRMLRKRKKKEVRTKRTKGVARQQ